MFSNFFHDFCSLFKCEYFPDLLILGTNIGLFSTLKSYIEQGDTIIIKTKFKLNCGIY